jgi:hypothetical protein
MIPNGEEMRVLSYLTPDLPVRPSRSTWTATTYRFVLWTSRWVCHLIAIIEVRYAFARSALVRWAIGRSAVGRRSMRSPKAKG